MDLSPIKKAGVCPKVSVMVSTAITALAGPKGSSLQAINKYISENYNADVQKLSFYIKKYLKSSVESGEIIQTSGKGARGSFKINKQKVGKEINSSKVKPSKVKSSTPEKTLKPKKAFAIKNSKKEMKLTDDQEIPLDSSFTISETKMAKKPRVPVPTKTNKSKASLRIKVKNTKKITAKVLEEPDTSFSPKEKLENGMVSSRDVKAEDALNTVDAEKHSAPEENTETKTNFSNDEDVYDDSTFIISQPKTANKSNVSLLAKVKATKKLIAKGVEEPDISVSRKEKLGNAIVSSKPVKTKGIIMSTEVQKVSMAEKSQETKTSFTDDKEVVADSTFIISERKTAKRLRIPAPVKAGKSNVRRKIKATKKLIAKEIEKLDSSVSSEEKLENAIDSSNHVKSDDTPKSAEAKKVPTPEKSLKSKMNLADDKEVPVDSTSTKSKTKMTMKPRVSMPKRSKTKKSNASQEINWKTEMKDTKKLIAKILEDPDTSVSPKEQLGKTMVSSKHIKAESTPNSEEAKKVSTPEKSLKSKMNLKDDQEEPVDSTSTKSKTKMTTKPRVPVPKRSKTKKSNNSQEIDWQTKMKNTKKIIAKILEEFDTSVSPNEQLGNIMVSSKHIKVEGTPNSEEVKKVSTPEKKLESKTNPTDDPEALTDSTFTDSEIKLVKKSQKKKPRASIPTKSRKLNASLQAKNKEPKKLMAEVEGLNASELSKRKLNNVATSSKREKTNGVYKSVKTKKNVKIKQADSVKKVVTKNISLEDGEK